MVQSKTRNRLPPGLREGGPRAGRGRTCLGTFLLLAVSATLAGAQPSASDYRFDSTMSRTVLENYLNRSITFTELLHDDLSKPRNSRGVDPRDNIRFLTQSGAKLVGRAIMIWGRESNLPIFLQRAKPFVDTLHKLSPDMILQAAAFEIVTKDVETLSIPAYVFQAFGRAPETRNFRYADMLFSDGLFVNHWGSGSVPDMGKLETRLWFYYLSTQYIDIGIEAIHFGQVGLMDARDPGHAGWLDMLGKVRAYAKMNARRHFILCDAHAPTGGFVEGGKLLFDLHTFPMRIAETVGQPYKATLKIGFTDAIYGKSKGGITPSGWSCKSLPYLVEFDNFGVGSPGTTGKFPFVWGWDEITWFGLMAEAERNDWLRYAWKWVADNDSVGFLQMPGSRVMSPGASGKPTWFWPNNKSEACPNGFNTEAVIRELWGTAVTVVPPRKGSRARWERVTGEAGKGYGLDGRLRPVESPQRLVFPGPR